MNNNEKLKQAITDTFKELKAMSREEFHAALEESRKKLENDESDETLLDIHSPEFLRET
jgi:tartrate dehydratase alpha subunit/fumarate hydratase class I-like protein